MCSLPRYQWRVTRVGGVTSCTSGEESRRLQKQRGQRFRLGADRLATGQRDLFVLGSDAREQEPREPAPVAVIATIGDFRPLEGVEVPATSRIEHV